MDACKYFTHQAAVLLWYFLALCVWPITLRITMPDRISDHSPDRAISQSSQASPQRDRRPGEESITEIFDQRSRGQHPLNS